MMGLNALFFYKSTKAKRKDCMNNRNYIPPNASEIALGVTHLL